MKINKTLPLLLIALLLVSCNENKTEDYNEGCEIQYKLTLKDNNHYNKYLLQNIEINKSNTANTISYHRTNSEYVKYLDSLTKQMNNGEELFFEGDKYSKAGKEFISRTNKCENDLLQLTINGNHKHRLHYILNTNDPEKPSKAGEVAENNEKNEAKGNVIHFKYLDYYFKGLPKIHIETLLSNKKRSLLELENEFLISQKPVK